MIYIQNGRAKFYQWDLNQRLVVENEIVEELHFTNFLTTEALITEVYELDGVKVADVPNILLQSDWDITVYGACGECVREMAKFKVEPRVKPSDYVYTETEVKSWEKLAQEVEEAVEQVNSSLDAFNSTIGNVCNSITGSATGEIIKLYDISPLEHNLQVKLTSKPIYVETVTELENVSYDYAEIEERDYIVSSVEYDGAYDCEIAWIKDSDIVFFGDDINSSTVSMGDIIRVEITHIEADEEIGIFEEWIENYYLVKQVPTDAPTTDFTTITLNRYGNTSGDNLKTYTPNENGTVEGVTSLFPITTLSTDTEGVTIEVEYNKDINKVIQSLLNTLTVAMEVNE